MTQSKKKKIHKQIDIWRDYYLSVILACRYNLLTDRFYYQSDPCVNELTVFDLLPGLYLAAK